MDVLDPFVAAGIPIVGLEPSCILTFRDELPSFFPHDERAADLAAHSLMLDEFLVREAPDFIPPELNRRGLMQGDICHKGRGGIKPATRRIRRPYRPKDAVRVS